MTPKDLLFVLPVGVGGVFAALLAGFVLWPQWQSVQIGRSRVAELRELEAQLPLLDSQLNRERQGIVLAQQKQDVVLQLIAGSGSLATFLAQVDRLAAKSGVSLMLFEPLAVAPEPSDSKKKVSEKDKAAPPPPTDPLQAPGLQKQQVLLSAKGNYPALLSFMQALEKLNVLVVQSNLQLSLDEPKDKANMPRVLPVIVKMSVATYGKKPS